MATNVPPVTFGPNGFIAPPESEVLAGVKADINAAFGGDLNMADETPQGQLAVTETAVIGQANSTFVFITNQVDPAYAQGRMQDAIARIYFLNRNPALPTIVTATCTGLVGVVIPAGAIAIAEDGNLYTCTNGGTIPAGGSISLAFACDAVGPIPCPAGSLNQIYQAIPGWDSITNPDDGILGQDVESRAAFEARRVATTAGNSFGAAGSIIGAVAKVSGVLDFYGYDNGTDSPVTVTGVSIDANSIFICVVGGTDLDIAQAILSKKGPGCGYTGNTSVTAYDNNPLYSAPIAYTVKFERPTDLSILFAVQIANGPLVPADAEMQIENAIIAAFAGSDGGPRARIGAKLYASRFYAAIASLGAWAQIISVLVGSTNDASAEFTAGISGTTMTVSATASGAVAVGQTISGTGVAEGTTVLSGSDPTWTVSISQTVAGPTDMIGAVANLNDLQVDINQVPTISAANIVVTLA